MKNHWLSFALVVTCCLLPNLSVAQSDYTLTLSDAAGSECSDAVVSVDLVIAPSALAVNAWSLGVCSSAAALDVNAVELGADVPPGPDFEQVNLLAGGWTTGVVLSFLGLTQLPPGGSYQLHAASYTPLGTIGSSSAVSFCDTLGSPAVETVLSDFLGGSQYADSSDVGLVTSVSPAPVNDNCQNALAATVGLQTFTLCSATTDGQPVVCSFDDAGPDDQIHQDVWYCFSPSCTNPVTVSTVGSGLETRIAVYAGCGCAGATGQLLACAGNSTGSPTGGSIASFTAQAGESYMIRVGTATGTSATGEGVLRLSRDVSTCLVSSVGGVLQLPPVCCDYVGIAQLHTIVDGLPPGTTLQIAARHQRFLIIDTVPSPCGTMETFDSTVVLEITGTGTLAGFERTLEIDLPNGQVCTGEIDTDLPIQTVNTEMLNLFGILNDDPDFEMLSVCAGTDLGYDSPGQLTLVQDDMDPTVFELISEFDINYCIEFAGAAGGVLDGLSGSTVGGAVMSSGSMQSFRRGDANGDGSFDVADPVFLLNFLFVPGSPPLGCPDAADVNDDGSNNIADGVTALSALFIPGQPGPPAPGSTTCGTDPTFDDLGPCEQLSCPPTP